MFNKENATSIDTVEIRMQPHAFSGLQKQGMTFPQAVFELVDNALAAAKPDEKARVVVALAPDVSKESFWLAVADWGEGMGLQQLDHALQIGCSPTGSNRLHEHGFGLKNAIAAMVGDGDFALFTHQAPGDYLTVVSPYCCQMPVYAVPALELPCGLNLKWPDPSTVVLLRIPMRYTASLQRNGKLAMSDLVTIRSWIVEHLGVTYRGYLEIDPATVEPSAKIVVTIDRNEIFIPPMPVPMMMTKTETFDVELNGQVVPIQYTHGLLDENLRDHMVLNKKAKFYYRGNQPTQGIDIRLGKRVIASAQLPEIWHQESGKPEPRHNHYNAFVGELLIPELPRGVLSTLWNKTDINYADEDWGTIFNALQEYPPEKHEQSLCEEKVKKQWAEMLEATCPGDRISREFNVWCSGTRIDVLHEGNGKCVVYEVKIRKAEPLDLYQLRMYWDGLVVSGLQPTEGILIASSCSANLQKMLDQLNQMSPPLFPDGSPSGAYNFSLASLKEKCLDKISDVAP